ncbi:hypothetical protein C922_05147 [Plasmodium inui San Antonio 1]|uniref:Uncharacterized protein n=1 Tax=Plasmodium inui San Antonio 1 TaxID=1237626 RepID=W7A5U7_9APIC|nr:hypothetical protein C922_05147 [Plasmodium inui San Antonio 1]EUD64459.1 hypothetical protein C922_05147 [Plasmodium inui San Antonio 1]
MGGKELLGLEGAQLRDQGEEVVQWTKEVEQRCSRGTVRGEAAQGLYFQHSDKLNMNSEGIDLPREERKEEYTGALGLRGEDLQRDLMSRRIR